jgi:hypothetical protein
VQRGGIENVDEENDSKGKGKEKERKSWKTSEIEREQFGEIEKAEQFLTKPLSIIDDENSEKTKGNPEISEKVKLFKTNLEFGKQQIPLLRSFLKMTPKMLTAEFPTTQRPFSQ